MVEVFDGAVVKKHFLVNFQRSEVVCFWSLSRESVKELIYQQKDVSCSCLFVLSLHLSFCFCCLTRFKADLHCTVLSHGTSLRHAYDTSMIAVRF